MHLPVAREAASITARSKALEWMSIYVGLAHSKLWRAKLLDTTPWDKKIRDGGSHGLLVYRGRTAQEEARTATSHLTAQVGNIVFCLTCGSYA